MPWSVIAKLLKDKLAPAQTNMHGMTICYTRQSVSTSGELTSQAYVLDLLPNFDTGECVVYIRLSMHFPGSELCQVYQHGKTVA